MLAVSDAETAARLRSERNQGRAPNMSWVDHDRLGFNYRLTDVAGRARGRPARAARRDARRPRPGRGALRRAAGGARLRRPAGEGDPAGLVLPCADERRGAAELVRLRGPAAGAAPTAMPWSPTSPSAGSRRRRTCRASTCSTHIRERFGFEGRPVPGRRGRLGATARAAVLPGDRRRSRSTASARRSPRRCGGTGRERRGADELVETPTRAPLPGASCARRAARSTGRWSATACAASCSSSCSPSGAGWRSTARSRSARRSSTTPASTTGLARRRLHRRGRGVRRAAVHRGRRAGRARAGWSTTPAPTTTRFATSRGAGRGRAAAARRPDRGQRRGASAPASRGARGRRRLRRGAPARASTPGSPGCSATRCASGR